MRFGGSDFVIGISSRRGRAWRLTPGCARLAMARVACPGLQPAAGFAVEEIECGAEAQVVRTVEVLKAIGHGVSDDS